MSRADDLTVLLTLKDRVPFTFRWLSYADHVAFPFKVLIADGGSDDAIERALADPDRYPRVNVEYRRYPWDATYAHYYAKLADALARVTTPFVVLADNDDFFMINALNSAAQFLSDNPDYVACGGQCAVFWVAAPRPDGHDAAVYGETVDWKCSSQMHSERAGTARGRTRDRSMEASDFFYAVHRTHLLRRTFDTVRIFNPRDLFLMEHLVEFLTAIAGKTRQMEMLYIARQQNAPSSSGGMHQERFGGWFDRMLVPTWSEDFARFVDLSSEALAQADGISLDEARREVVASYKMWVAPSLLEDLLEEPSVTPSMPIVLQVVRHLVRRPRTSAIRRLAKALYRRTRWVSHDLVHGTEFRTRRAGDSSHQFRPIYEFLTGRHGR